MFDPNKGCFGNFAITHYRPNEGYTKTWYDVENADEQTKTFKFVAPSFNGDIYFMAESYFENVVD
jgi:hypothetical protein